MDLQLDTLDSPEVIPEQHSPARSASPELDGTITSATDSGTPEHAAYELHRAVVAGERDPVTAALHDAARHTKLVQQLLDGQLYKSYPAPVSRPGSADGSVASKGQPSVAQGPSAAASDHSDSSTSSFSLVDNPHLANNAVPAAASVLPPGSVTAAAAVAAPSAAATLNASALQSCAHSSPVPPQADRPLTAAASVAAPTPVQDSLDAGWVYCTSGSAALKHVLRKPTRFSTATSPPPPRAESAGDPLAPLTKRPDATNEPELPPRSAAELALIAQLEAADSPDSSPDSTSHTFSRVGSASSGATHGVRSVVQPGGVSRGVDVQGARVVGGFVAIARTAGCAPSATFDRAGANAHWPLMLASTPGQLFSWTGASNKALARAASKRDKSKGARYKSRKGCGTRSRAADSPRAVPSPPASDANAAGTFQGLAKDEPDAEDLQSQDGASQHSDGSLVICGAPAAGAPAPLPAAPPPPEPEAFLPVPASEALAAAASAPQVLELLSEWLATERSDSLVPESRTEWLATDSADFAQCDAACDFISQPSVDAVAGLQAAPESLSEWQSPGSAVATAGADSGSAAAPGMPDIPPESEQSAHSIAAAAEGGAPRVARATRALRIPDISDGSDCDDSASEDWNASDGFERGLARSSADSPPPALVQQPQHMRSTPRAEAEDVSEMDDAPPPLSEDSESTEPDSVDFAMARVISELVRIPSAVCLSGAPCRACLDGGQCNLLGRSFG